jgi:hypothetical protein
MYLTIGHESKYRPLRGSSFGEAALQISRSMPGAFIVAVGPRPEGQWADLRRRSGGNIMAVGAKTHLEEYFEAADIYLEGFPMGSLTALLEAGAAGLPFVRAPMTSAPPFASDDIALVDFPQPQDVRDYVALAIALGTDSAQRASLGSELRRAIHQHHCGSGWKSHLGELHASLPAAHSTHDLANATPLPETATAWWLEKCAGKATGAPLEHQLLALVREAARRSVLADGLCVIPEAERMLNDAFEEEWNSFHPQLGQRIPSCNELLKAAHSGFKLALKLHRPPGAHCLSRRVGGVGTLAQVALKQPTLLSDQLILKDVVLCSIGQSAVDLLRLCRDRFRQLFGVSKFTQSNQ